MNALLAALLTAPGLALAQDLNVTGGASQSNSTPVSYANATVSGQSGGVPSTYTANAAFAASGNLTLGDTGVFNANATTTIGGDTSLSGGARLNLVSGSFQTNALSLSSLSEVVRGSGSDTLRISRFDVSNAALTLKAGDQVYGEQTNNVASGATVTNTGMATINGRLVIYGSSGTTRSTFNSNVPVTFSQGLLSQSGQLNVNANTTFGGNVDIQYDGAILALNSGTLSAPGIGVYYGARATRSGGFYNVTNFYLDNGATLDYLPGDSITGALTLSGASTRLTQLKALDISSLAVNPGADLMLTGFGGSGYGIDHWALSLPGNVQSTLLGYLADGRIKYSGVNSVNVTFDATVGRTFVLMPVLSWASSGGIWSTSPADTPWSGGQPFTQGQNVSFGNGGSGTVAISGTVAPASFGVSGSTGYTFTSSPGNQVVGATALTKTGAGTATLTGPNAFSGGTTIDAGTLRVGHDGALGSGTVALNGGTFAAADGTARSLANAVSIGGNVTVGDATGTGAVTFTGAVSLGGATRTVTAVADTTFAGVISNGGLVKQGSGVLSLTAANTFTGNTTVNAGTLRLAGAGALASAVVTVAPGATLDRTTGNRMLADLVVNGNVAASGGSLTVVGTLSGTGTIDGTTVIAGIHAPGNSPGIQSFTGNLTYQGSLPRVRWELTANTATQGTPATFDQILVGGTLGFSSATLLDLLFASPGSSVDWTDTFWASDRTWLLYDVGGSLTGLGNFALSASNWADRNGTLLSSIRTGYGFTIAQSGQDVVLNYAQGSPGPGPGPGVPEIDPNSAGGVVALVAGFLAWFERQRGRSRRPWPSPALPRNRSADLLTAVAQAVAALAAAMIIGRPVTAATTDTVQYLSSPASYGAVGNGLNLEFGTKAFPPLAETALEAYQVQGSGPVTLTFRMHADTGSFRFNFGYYKYLPSLNAIDTSTTAGKQAYATTALAPGNAVLVFNDVIHDPGATATKTVNGGDLLGFFLIPDDTLANFQTSPGSFAVTGVGSATFGIGGARRWPFFGYAAANPGGKDQLMSFAGTSKTTGNRSNMFAWEDISRAALPGDFFCDNAFNDLIFAVEGVEAAATTPSAIPEIDPGSVAGVAALVIATLAWIERRRR